jgi:hypothetical protein
MKYIRILLVFWVINAVTPAVAQIDAEAHDFVYLLPSKEIAETGEDLWFKAYLINSQTLAPSERSHTLYLQLRTAADSVVWSEKYPLFSGRANGHIYIGAEWPQGEYFMEGYTKSSFSSDSSKAILPRRIRVVDRVTQMESISRQAIKNDANQKQSSQHRFDLFPEGGHLIYGINSVVAFKATYGNGMPEDVSGIVLEDGKKIETVKTIHDGMGYFSLTPKSGKEYKVFLDDCRTIPFPTIEPEGMSLRLSKNNAKTLSLLVSSSEDAPQPFSITAKQNGIVCCSAEGIVKGHKIVKFSADYFTLQGIVEITLFDAEKRPVAERLVFVNPEKQLSVTATTDKKQYNTRDTGKVRLQVTDTSGKPIKAELAVSVFDKAYLYLPGHENILSHCLLSEQIRGNIFNPTYYFDEQNDDRIAALDLLMLTQGWRNYVWDKEQPSSEQLLTDGVSGMQTTKRNINSKTQLIKTSSANGDARFVFTDSLGRFEIDPQLMEEMPGHIYLQPMLTSKYKAKISVESPFDTINVHRLNRPHYLAQNQFFESNSNERPVNSDNDAVLLKEVVVKAKHKSIHRDKMMGYLDSLANAEARGQEWVCVHVNEKDVTEEFHILNDYYSDFTAHPGRRHCDGGREEIPIPGETYLLVKVTPYIDETGLEHMYINRMVEIVYPKRTFTDEQLLKKYNMVKTQGYYPKREFYQPDSFDLQSSSPDPRNLLQWQPEVITDNNGVAEVSFAASDINTEFIGIVEAIDGSGLMGCKTFNFRVLKK